MITERRPLSGLELVGLARLVKAAQEKKYRPAKPSAAYPSYSRSLVTQLSEDPRAAGRKRALTTGALAAVLSALAARLATDNPRVVGGAALGGGLLGAVPGYMSGKREAESEKSRLLFLRRLGVSRPGELEALLRSVDPAAEKSLTEGATI